MQNDEVPDHLQPIDFPPIVNPDQDDENGFSEEDYKLMFQDLLHWVLINRPEWIQELKQKLQNLPPEERNQVKWSGLV